LPYGIYNDVYDIIRNQSVTMTQSKPKKIPDRKPDPIIILEEEYEIPDDNQNILDIVPEQIIFNDSQNVHSSSVNNIALQKINKIETSTNINNNYNNNFIEFENEIKRRTDLSDKDKENAIKLANSLKDSKHSRFDKSEIQIFNTVWSRINDPINSDRKEDMIKVFAQNLASGIEHSYAVCSTGKVMRMLGSLDAMDAGELPDLKPEWAINQEIAQSAAKIREDVLNNVSDKEREEYNTGESKLSEIMKNTFKEKCKKDYVDSNILSAEKLDKTLEDYIDSF
jgi:hypothetical protein